MKIDEGLEEIADLVRPAFKKAGYPLEMACWASPPLKAAFIGMTDKGHVIADVTRREWKMNGRAPALIADVIRERLRQRARRLDEMLANT